MMRKIFCIAFLLIAAFSAKAQKVTFFSPQFEEGVRLHIGLGETEDVLQTQTDTITRINLSGLGITDIRDAVYLTAVEELDLSYNEIEDVSPLLPLESLRVLNLSNNLLEDVNILAFFQAERMEVDVTNNYISDFSYFFSPTPCEFSFLGMGLQLVKDAPYFDVYQFYVDINDEGLPVFSYRGYTNMAAAVNLKSGSESMSAQLDGETHTVAMKNCPSEIVTAVLTNGENEETTYVLPPTDYSVEAGMTVTLTTGLPDDYRLSYAYAETGSVKIIDKAIEYTAPGEAREDIVYFCYFLGNTLKGYSRIYINRKSKGVEKITISKARQLAYFSNHDLNFTDVEGLKAYVATGYDKATGTIWLSRLYDVPARTGILLMGEPDTYEVPVSATGSPSYYKNMFKGTLDGTALQTTDGDFTNYYLSNGSEGVGFYKVGEKGVTLGSNRAYLPIPTVINAVGEAGSTVAISVGGAEQVPYYSDQSLDFTKMADKGMKAYTATGYDYSTGTIWLSRVNLVPALTGVLIMAPKGSYDVPTASVASVYENMFKGTLGGTTILTEEDGFINYYLSNGAEGVGFYKVTKEGGVALGKNRCYLQIPKVNPSAASRGAEASQTAADTYGIVTSDVIGIPLFGSTGTTGTNSIENGKSDNDIYYNLNGQRIDKPGKGLYIHNGKMVIIK
jgi:hypothetical protein